MEKPLWYRWARVFAAGGAIVGSGVLAYVYARPTDEELIASFSPEVRANYERNLAIRQKEQEQLDLIIAKALKSDEPIWKAGGIVSPWDDKNAQLFDRDTLEKEVAKEKQMSELEKAKQELVDNKNLAASTAKKSWFRWN